MVVGFLGGIFASTLFPQRLIGGVEAAAVGAAVGLGCGALVGAVSALVFGRRPGKDTDVSVPALVLPGVAYASVLWATHQAGFALLALILALAARPFVRGWVRSLRPAPR
jgi:hypothetical protein